MVRAGFPCRHSFFLPVRVLSSVFKKKFLIYLRNSFCRGKLKFHGEMAGLAKPTAFEALCRKAKRIDWVVYAKPPFGGPEQVLKYVARYTHRVAISNQRLRSMEAGSVTFEWKDYASGNKSKTMTLDAVEFIRRFLLHILPGGFVRIRQFGFLANRVRKQKLALCRSLLAVQLATFCPANPAGDGKTEHRDLTLCPVCKRGHLITIEVIWPATAPMSPPIPELDSS
jgi:Putative transposase